MRNMQKHNPLTGIAVIAIIAIVAIFIITVMFYGNNQVSPAVSGAAASAHGAERGVWMPSPDRYTAPPSPAYWIEGSKSYVLPPEEVLP